MKNRKVIIYFLTVLFLVLFIKPSFAEDSTITSTTQIDSSAVLSPVDSTKAEEKPVLNLKYENGVLDVEIKSSTIKDIFEELKKQAGVNYEIEKEISEQKVSISFKEKELTQAIKEILNTIGNPSYMLSYKKDRVGKYQVANINIRKRGSTEAVTVEKRELQEREMEIGFIDGKYKIRANKVDANKLLDALSAIGDINGKIFADKIDGTITINAEEGMISMTFLQEELLAKVRPKIYKVNRKLVERDKNGKITKPAYFKITRLTDIEIQHRREEALKSNEGGEKLLEEGNISGAIEAFEGSYGGWDNDYHPPLKNLAKISLITDLPKEALGYLNEALEITKDDPEVYSLLGEAYKADNQMILAKENYQKALLISKDEKEKKELKNILSDLNSDKTKKWSNSLSMAKEFEKQNRYEEAEREIIKLIEVEPDLKRSYLRIADFYSEHKKFDKTVETIKKWLKKNPKDYEMFIYIGIAYNDLHQNDLTIENFKKALDLAPNEPRKNYIKYLIKLYGGDKK